MDVQGAIRCNDGGGKPFVEGGRRKHSSREGGEVICQERKPFVKGGCHSSREDAVHRAREVTVCREGRDHSSGGKRVFVKGRRRPFAKERRLFVQRGVRRVREGAVHRARDIK